MAIGVALCAAAVLLPAVWWGLPVATSGITARGWDVDGVAGIGVLSEMHNLIVQPRPDWYVAYPLLHYLILAVCYAPYLAYLIATGAMSSPVAAYPYGLGDPVRAFLVLGVIARAVTLAMAVGTVVAVWSIGRRLGGRAAGWLAAALCTVTVPFAFYARTSNLDVPVLFWSALALLLMIRAVQDGLSTRLAIGIGITSGLAAATKDQGVATLVPALLVTFWYIGRAAAPPIAPWRAIGLLIVVGVGTYAIAMGIPVRPQRTVRHLAFVLGFEQTFTNLREANQLTVLRPTSVAGYWSLSGDVLRAVIAAVGLPAVAAGTIGLSLRGAGQGRAVLVAALAGFLLLAIAPIHHMQYRYALLPSLVLAVGAGLLMARLRRLASASRFGALAPLAFAFIVLAAPALGTIDLTWQMLADARYDAGNWLAREAKPGDALTFFGRPHQLPAIPDGVRVEPLSADPAAEARLRAGEFAWVIVAADYFADSSRTRSQMLPDSTWRRLLDGSLGLRLVHTSSRASLLGRPLAYLPYVNPVVRIFARADAAPAGHTDSLNRAGATH
jgi:4-amino-4-deoxy-L-arabinose transferase-like glycosyltransferase